MKLWIPGPTQVRPEILQELTLPMIGHRSQAMVDLIERIDPGLRNAFGLGADSKSTVAVGNHSGTGAMESSLRGVGDRILCVVNGAFSKRWRDIAQVLGKQVHTLDLEWGDAASQKTLRLALGEHGPFDAVTVVVNETSTGVRSPMEQVRAALNDHPDTLLLCDVVSGIAGYALDFDQNGMDLAFAGIQKAFALPPGIAVICASERFLDGARQRASGSWYLDPAKTIDGHVARKPPVTPAIPQYRALAKQLEDIDAGWGLSGEDANRRGADAWGARFERHERMQARTLEWAAGHGLQPFPRRELCAPTVSCIRAGEIDVPALIAGLKQEGHEIGNGYGVLKNKTFRIGHMGDHNEADLEELLSAADRVLG
ncbi:MAG: aspartate aminotransferase-like enzyme [Planctomycetota bacterium]|jgi:aspartate aminotransferase-like enzyme